MNQNQVKLLWGLRACQPPPSILLAPGQCNSVCREASLMYRVAGSFLCVPCQVYSTGRYGESDSMGAEEVELGSRGAINSVGIKVYLTHVTELEHLLPS